MFDFIVQFITDSGYLGIFGLMALENIFPPIPSEMIMPLGGFIVARGELSLVGVLLAGTAGSVAGALPWYYAGKMYGKDRLRKMACRHGRWLTVSAEDIDESLAKFDKHGNKIVLFGRLIPAIRSLVSIPAGISKMPLMPFLAYSTAGSLVWTALLTGAGFFLEAKYEDVAEYVDPVSKAILGLILAGYLYRLFSQGSRTKPK